MHLLRPAQDEGARAEQMTTPEHASGPGAGGFGPAHDGDYDFAASFDNGRHRTVGCGRSGGHMVAQITIIRR